MPSWKICVPFVWNYPLLGLNRRPTRFSFNGPDRWKSVETRSGLYTEWCRTSQPNFCRQFTLHGSNFSIRHHIQINTILKCDWLDRRMFHGVVTSENIFLWPTKDFPFGFVLSSTTLCLISSAGDREFYCKVQCQQFNVPLAWLKHLE
jgi:hypothetical protein